MSPCAVLAAPLLLRSLNSGGPVAAAERHDVGVLVVGVLTLSGRATTRRAPQRRILSGGNLSTQRPRPVVLLERVPLRHRQAKASRRLSLSAGRGVVVQTARYRGKAGEPSSVRVRQARKTSSHWPFVISSAHDAHSFSTVTPSRVSVRTMHAWISASPNVSAL